MADIAYMTREDWAEDAQGMERNSRKVADWLGKKPHVALVTKAAEYDSKRLADKETAAWIAQFAPRATVASFSELARLQDPTQVPMVALHPYLEADLEALRHATKANVLGRVFVMVWSPADKDVMAVLQSLDAHDLSGRRATLTTSPVVLEAAKWMLREEYNGLGGGRGKDVVLSLLAAFASSDHAVAPQEWATAVLRADGKLRSAGQVRTFAEERADGKQHRYNTVGRTDIVGHLEERATRG